MNLVAHLRSRLTAAGNTRAVTYLPDSADDQPVQLSYAELDSRARAIATWLTGQQLADTPVLLLHPPGLDFLATFLGCLYARVLAVPAPLPQTGPHHLARVNALARDTGAAMILTDRAHLPLLDTAGLRATIAVPNHQTGADDWVPPQITAEAIAYLQYTSGSTSQPRGVRIPHSALLHNLRMIHATTTEPPQAVAGWLPHYHDMGLVGLQLHALSAGANLVLTAPATFVARPVVWLDMISRYRATCTVASDFGYAWAARRVSEAQRTDLDLSCLTMAYIGAEPIRPSTLDSFTRRFAPAGFRCHAWVPSYGLAEATLLVTSTRQGQGPTIGRFDPAALEHHRAEPTPDGTPVVSVGRAIDLTLRIADLDTHQALPDRRVGELWVSGASVAAGYHGQPDATRDTFHAGGGAWLRTGDLAFLQDGNLYITGRIKETIIINGRNLYPHDIEDTARRAHPATATGAAFAVIDPDRREHVLLVQEIRPGHPPTEQITDALTAAVGRELHIPISIVLVPKGTVPRTTSGKLRRRHLRELLLHGQLEAIHQQLTQPVADLIRAPT